MTANRIATKKSTVADILTSTVHSPVTIHKIRIIGAKSVFKMNFIINASHVHDTILPDVMYFGKDVKSLPNTEQLIAPQAW
jgi:hypothetical protein